LLPAVHKDFERFLHLGQRIIRINLFPPAMRLFPNVTILTLNPSNGNFGKPNQPTPDKITIGTISGTLLASGMRFQAMLLQCNTVCFRKVAGRELVKRQPIFKIVLEC
jgi:hypothetical protein